MFQNADCFVQFPRANSLKTFRLFRMTRACWCVWINFTQQFAELHTTHFTDLLSVQGREKSVMLPCESFGIPTAWGLLDRPSSCTQPQGVTLPPVRYYTKDLVSMSANTSISLASRPSSTPATQGNTKSSAEPKNPWRALHGIVNRSRKEVSPPPPISAIFARYHHSLSRLKNGKSNISP